MSLVNIVAQLHDENIVHRDIKPANVFVRVDSMTLVPVIWHRIFCRIKPARFATRTNESVGPHEYMPPVQTGGRLNKVETNFDVYMLGKLLWCIVMGRLLC